MPNSRAIDAALIGRLIGDTTLMAILTDGVYRDVATQNATKFAIVSIVEAIDESVYGGRAIEDVLYSVKAVALNTSGADVSTAAARIDALLEGQPLTVSGYVGMDIEREERFGYTEDDDVDRSKRWQHAGGRYRVRMSIPGR